MEIIVRRYFPCVLDEIYLYRAIRYVEQNLVRAKMVKDAWDYKWSSARTHAGTEIFIKKLEKRLKRLLKCLDSRSPRKGSCPLFNI